MRPWQKFGLVGGFIGWDVFNVSAFVWSLRSPAKVIGTVELHPLFFLLVACISIPVTVAISGCLFWEQMSERLPRNKFHALVDELREVKKAIFFYGPHKATLGEVEGVLTIQRKLNNLSIQTPPLDDYRQWLVFLPVVTSLADTEDLKEARKGYRSCSLTRR